MLYSLSQKMSEQFFEIANNLNPILQMKKTKTIGC